MVAPVPHQGYVSLDPALHPRCRCVQLLHSPGMRYGGPELSDIPPPVTGERGKNTRAPSGLGPPRSPRSILRAVSDSEGSARSPPCPFLRAEPTPACPMPQGQPQGWHPAGLAVTDSTTRNQDRRYAGKWVNKVK